jgi:monoamine oxidase
MSAVELHARRVAARGFSRREFLKRSGALGAGIAVAGPAWFGRSARAAAAPRVAIVGGGIAGLAAALTLADEGVSSTVYEASTRLGGRMHSDSPVVTGGDDFFCGQTAEWCGELIDTDHKTILHLAQRFALPTVDLLAAEPNGSQETYWFRGDYYSYQQASDDFQPVHNTLQGQVQAAGYPTLWSSYTQAGWYFDHLSMYDWIEQYVPGGHAARFGRLLDVAYNEEYGAETSDQSSLNVIYELGYNASPGNFAIYGKSDERYHIDRGNQRLPEAIAAYLQGTGLTQIQTGYRMNAISLNRNGTVSLTFDGQPSVVADQVILCMSFSVLRNLDYSRAGFDRLKRTAITQLGSGRSAKLQLQFDTRYWNQTGAWGISNGDVYTDLGFQNAWDVTRGQSGATGILVNYTGGKVAGAFAPSTPYSNTQNNSSQVAPYAQSWLTKLETVFPGITPHWNNKATLSVPALDPNFNCSYPYWRVGQYTGFGGYEKTPQGPAGQIHFAGDHCSQDFQGFMEGGASEGVRAANETLNAIKLAMSQAA